MNTVNKNRLHALASVKGSPRLLRRELKRMIASTDQRMARRLRMQAIALIRQDAFLMKRFEALTSICGIGDISAIALLSGLVALPGTLSSRACVSHAGRDPRVFKSATCVHKAPRISRRGNKYLHRALFLPALAAASHDPGANAFKERLLARGKKFL